MTPLPLSGQADSIAGFARGSQPRALLRLCDPAARCPESSYDVALVKDEADANAAKQLGFGTFLTVNGTLSADTGLRVVRVAQRFDYLADGDIISLDINTRRFRTLYRRASEHNSFLVTEQCNHMCLMCSQPPRNVDDGWIIDEIAEALPLIHPATAAIGFTGGEPLTDWRRFLSIIALMKKVLPTTAVHVLTNGRYFSSREVANAWALLNHPRLCAAIPLYSCIDVVHDHIVQARGAFDETLHGILRLKDKGQRIEIRVVLHKLTIPSLVDTCKWFARNLPFVDHIALMGLENTGFALANQDALWIDPMDYRDELARSVDILSAARINVSIYNLPRCVLSQNSWPFAVQSISDWKNAFLPECNRCVERPRCGGFFSSGRPKFSRGVKAIQ